MFAINLNQTHTKMYNTCMYSHKVTSVQHYYLELTYHIIYMAGYATPGFNVTHCNTVLYLCAQSIFVMPRTNSIKCPIPSTVGDIIPISNSKPGAWKSIRLAGPGTCQLSMSIAASVYLHCLVF